MLMTANTGDFVNLIRMGSKNMTVKVTLTPLRKYTFDEIGKFIFQSHWKDNKDIGINQHLVKIMMNSFDAEWLS